jgi:ribosomal protein S12 methylthiotransferase
LLREIQRIEGDFWVRLLYTHPAHWSEELIETIAACDKVCRYVDIPLQHINDEVLKRMRRETSGRYIRELIKKIRAGVPGIAIRTTFIVGFPGETDAQFEELLQFIEEARFERLGVFKYSQEDHTPAGAMAEQLSNKVKKERFHRAMALQQKVSRKVMRSFVGKELRVLVEAEAEGLPREIAESMRQNGPMGAWENGRTQGRRACVAKWWRGRSHADAPEIDGAVYVRGDARAGEFARVKIVGATQYDLAGEVIG